MAGEVDSEMRAAGEQAINIDVYRELVKTYIDLHLYSAALFWADKVVSLSNDDPKDVFWLAQCMFHMKQYHRAAHVICSRGLEKTNMSCQYIAVRSLVEAHELNSALQILTENELSAQVGDHPAPGNDSYTSNASTIQVRGTLLFLKGKVYEALENRGIAVEYYKQALRTDVHCYEAFEALVHHQMLSAQEGVRSGITMPILPRDDAEGIQTSSQQRQQEMGQRHFGSPQRTVLVINQPMMEFVAGTSESPLAGVAQPSASCDFAAMMKMLQEQAQEQTRHQTASKSHN